MNRILKYLGTTAGILCLFCMSACSGSGEDDPTPNPGPDPNPEPGQTDVAYVQQLLCMDFTSTGCVNCPMMASALTTADVQYPGQLAIAALHMNYGGYTDPMHLAITETYANRLKIEGLPTGILNIRPESKFSSDKTTIDRAIADELIEHTAICGVAVESSYAADTRELSVTAKITSNEAKTFRYLILLTENGIVNWQYGSEEGIEYIHNHVVRTLLSNSIYGERLNQGQALTPGVEATGTRSTTLPKEWDAGCMQIIVAALMSEDNGVTWVCNNARTCKLGEEADYLISSDAGSNDN